VLLAVPSTASSTATTTVNTRRFKGSLLDLSATSLSR